LFQRGLRGFEKAFKLAVRGEKGDDPVPIGPEVGGPVVDLRRRPLHFVKLAAKEIKIIPFRPRLVVVAFERRMRLAEIPDAVDLAFMEFFQHAAPGAGIYLEAVQEQVEFQQAGEQHLPVLKKVDLIRVIRKTGSPDILFDALPMIGGDMIASIGQSTSGCLTAKPADRFYHFFME